MTATEEQITQAQTVVNAYGKVLAAIEVVNYGLPISLLPFSKDQIKDAIQLLLWELEDFEEKTIRDSLVQAYVYLAQFVPDEQADILTRGNAILNNDRPSKQDWDYAEQSNKIINAIKLEMETALADMQKYL